MLIKQRKNTLHSMMGDSVMRVNILVCDDELSFAEKLSEMLYQQHLPEGISISIIKTNRAADLSDNQLSYFHIMFLDIDMGKCSGMDIARRVRKLHFETILIFVTNYPQFSLEGYEVRAFRYLLKRDLEQKLSTYYQDALAEIPKQKQALDFSNNSESYHVEYKNILYLESRKRIIYLHTLEPERSGYRFYGTMEKLAEELFQYGFLRIQKSFLVNMAHIRKLNYDKAQLDNGEMLPVSRQRFAEIKVTFFEWKSKQWRTL